MSPHEPQHILKHILEIIETFETGLKRAGFKQEEQVVFETYLKQLKHI